MAVETLKRANVTFTAFSSLLLLLVLCINHSVEAMGENEVEAHLIKQQAQYQATSKQQQQQQQTGDELIGQLLQLAAPTSGQPGSMATAGEEPVSMLTSTSKKQLFVTKPSKQADEKATLKRKLHKLVDELVDSSAGQPTDKLAASKRHLMDAGDAQDMPSQERRLTMILVKRKPQSLELDGGQQHQQQQAILVNGLGEVPATLAQAQPAQQPQERYLSAASASEHTRRILDDKFGILHRSIFSTNNQLGSKEVPKFGSDEQF